MATCQGVQPWTSSDQSDERPDTDAALLRLAQAGDSGATERLLSLHERSVYVLAYGMLGNADDAADLVQEAFYRALRSLNRFRGDCAFRTWLYRIAIHAAIERKRSAQLTATFLAGAASSAASTPSPENDVLLRMQASEALSRLQPRHRAILLLRELHGCSIPEIALAMQWNDKKVRNELFKARRALAEWRADNHLDSDSATPARGGQP